MSCSNNKLTDAEILALLFAIAPQFATDDPVKLANYEALIAALRCLINESLLGCCALLAFANLLAHYLTIQINPLIGVSNSISEGQLSISVATTVNGVAWGSTPYGQQYWQIVKNFKIGAYVTNTGRSFYGPSCCGGGGYGLGF